MKIASSRAPPSPHPPLLQLPTSRDYGTYNFNGLAAITGTAMRTLQVSKTLLIRQVSNVQVNSEFDVQVSRPRTKRCQFRGLQIPYSVTRDRSEEHISSEHVINIYSARYDMSKGDSTVLQMNLQTARG